MPRESTLKGFRTIEDFSAGYRNKRDVTKEKPGTAVSGSQNIITVDGEKIGNRPGYTEFGGTSQGRFPILGGGNWKTHTGVQFPWRSYDNGSSVQLEVYLGTVEGVAKNIWQTIGTGFNSASMRGASFWDTTEVQDLFLFVDGGNTIEMWSGGVTTFASATSNTITKQGTSTWAESRFLANGTRQVTIDGTTYTYTGGENTTTLTGVTPDPTVAGHAVGETITQTIRTSANTPASGFDNDFVKVLNNQLYVFDRERRDVYKSAVDDYTDYSFSSPRIVGEGALFTLDETPTAAEVFQKTMLVTTRNYIYRIALQLSDDLQNESVLVDVLKTSSLEGTAFDLGITKMKNFVVSVSNEPSIDNIGNIENIETPQNVDLSDPIKKDMDTFGVDRVVAGYFRKNFYVGLKSKQTDGSNNRLLKRNLATGAWETPWTMPVGILFEYNGEFYMHSSVEAVTYKLLDGYSDAGTPITSKWYSPFDNFGHRHKQKVFDKLWVDGYIKSDTDIDVYVSYDYGAEVVKNTIKGTNDDILIKSGGGGLGTYSLGTHGLGGTGSTKGTNLKRFRGFINIQPRPFYEMQVSFQSNGKDIQWEVVAYAMNVRLLDSQNNNLNIN